MPTYVYECPRCQRRQELVQSVKDRISPLCFEEACGQAEMVTVIQPSAFILKGSGWAKDGYARRSAADRKSAHGGK